MTTQPTPAQPSPSDLLILSSMLTNPAIVGSTDPFYDWAKPDLIPCSECRGEGEVWQFDGWEYGGGGKFRCDECGGAGQICLGKFSMRDGEEPADQDGGDVDLPFLPLDWMVA